MYGFTAFINDKKITGVCKEKQAATNNYEDAISEGHGAYLVDKSILLIFLFSQ